MLVFRLSTVAFEQQRQDYLEALGWVSGLMLATTPAQLIGPTPCEEFDVRLLMGHLVGTARHTPHVVTSVPDDDLAAAYASPARYAGPGRCYTERIGSRLSGGPAPLEAVRGFTVETITHGWDLAVAIGQVTHQDPSPIRDPLAAQVCLVA